MKNSKFSGSCEDAESLNLSEQNLGCDLNLDEQNALKKQNCAASNLSDESSVEALILNGQNSTSALNLDNLNSETTTNLNDQNLSSQNFTAAGIAAASNLDRENSAMSATATLNFKNKNSAATGAEVASKTMAGAAKTGSYNERRRSKNDENSAKRILRLQG